MTGEDDGALGLRDLLGGELELAAVGVEVRAEPGQACDHLFVGRVLGVRLLLECVLRDVDVDGAGTARSGDVERLGEDTRQVIGVTDEVVVLGHRQRDAVDVDLLERVLADQDAGHVAGDRDHRDGVEERGADARDEVRRAGTGRPHADADPAGDPSVAIGGMCATLLVPNEDVTNLRVVAEHVVERQDHAARVAEEDIDALADERLADDVGPDPRPAPRARVVEHPLAGSLDGGRGGRPIARHVRPTRAGTRRFGRIPSGQCHRSSPDPCCAQQKTLATRRGSLRSSVVRRLAPVPPRSSVLPPGAGNKAEKAVQPKKERAKNPKERCVFETGSVQGHLHATTITPDGNGNAAMVPTIEQTQCGLRVTPDKPTRRGCVRAVYGHAHDRATRHTAPIATGNGNQKRRPPETGGRRRCRVGPDRPGSDQNQR